MIELVQNLGTWFVNNLEIIKTVAMIVSVLLTITSMIVILIYKKLVNKIDISVQDLSHIVDNYSQLMESVKQLHTIVGEYDSTTHESIDKMLNVENIDAQMLKKMNSILDILALAYSTIKNDEIRLGIASIVNYAKYLDPNNELLAAQEKAKSAVKSIKQTVNDLKSAVNEKKTPEVKTETELKELVTNKVRRY